MHIWQIYTYLEEHQNFCLIHFSVQFWHQSIVTVHVVNCTCGQATRLFFFSYRFISSFLAFFIMPFTSVHVCNVQAQTLAQCTMTNTEYMMHCFITMFSVVGSSSNYPNFINAASQRNFEVSFCFHETTFESWNNSYAKL